MPETVLVTGAAGTIGQHLVRLLVNDGCDVRATVRSEAAAAKMAGLGANPVFADFEDRESLAGALNDVGAAVLITPAHEKADLYARCFIDAARRAALKRLIRVSALKAAADGPTENTRLHACTERYLEASGLPHVILRPHLFMQNLLISVQSLAADGTFSFSMGDGRMGMIDTRDIAQCAARCVLSDEHLGRTFELTGPQSLSWHDAAKVLSEVLARPVSYVPVDPQQQFKSLCEFGVDPWMAGVLRDYGTAYSAGWGNYTTEAVAEITGRPATGFRQFASDVIAPLVRNTGE
ncbi:SDR family oxidoreductase [Hoeflea sp. TYP-13]|uniref:SDR family oxidoreductase n=1 Tax=Hoeflea sp. TYP-13 TaxID=3230023 RepID=UPI0034C6A9CF